MKYALRRQQLLRQLHNPLLLFSGGEVARNSPTHAFPFRADSNFLYLFGPCEPGCAAFFDSDSGHIRFFAPGRTLQSALWTGPRPSFEELKEALKVEEVLEAERLEEEVERLKAGRPLSSLAVADERATRLAQTLTGLESLSFKQGQLGPPEVLKALALMRLYKDADELEEVRRAIDITCQAQLGVMQHTRPGTSVQELYVRLIATFARHSCTEAFATILTARGEILHNPTLSGCLQEEALLLLDAGAERPSGYCADITRTWPVSGKFSAQAKTIYEAVLEANRRCMEAVRPGVWFKTLQRIASEAMVEGLREAGLLRGSAENILEAGALSVFFPHGIGHLLGLEVHDMAAFGNLGSLLSESAPTQEKALGEQPKPRADLALKEGMLFTVEPGLYFIPSRIHFAEYRNTYGEFVNFEEAERYLQMHGGRGFGGIRIEDNVLCTQAGAEVLTAGLPKQLEEVEALIGTASERSFRPLAT